MDDMNKSNGGSSCASCAHHGLCQGIADGDPADSPHIRIDRHAILYQAGDAAGGHIYNIRSGSFKILRAAPQCAPQIVGFAVASEFIGLETLGRRQHANTVVALEDSEVCRIRWSRHATLRPSLHNLLSREIGREQRATLMLRDTRAEQRMADLLLSLSQRQTGNGGDAVRFRLPMSRCDIASYLGVTPECVSRLLLDFKRRALLQLCRRDVTLLDAPALHRLADVRAPGHPQIEGRAAA
ncbi:transcriptional regulatory protein btr [Rugamonas sp. R1(2021)]